MIVFLEVARTLPGQVRSIPNKDGKKYDWPSKITFHLDLEELAALKTFLTVKSADFKPFSIFHKAVDRNPKTFALHYIGEKGEWISKAAFEGKEIVLTLQRADISLLIIGLESLMEKMLWKTAS